MKTGWALPVLGALAAASPAGAQVPRPSVPSVQSGAPGSDARDALGRFTMPAHALAEPHEVDGVLAEAIYAAHAPVADFVQMEPAAGRPATEKTEVWVFFDARNLYVTFRVWESRPELAVANEMRRDSNNIRMGDCVGFSLDTFHDGRNAFQFEVNPLGARTDGQSVNERQYSADWNPVWRVSVGRFEGGWTVESALPFKSIRYQPGASQTWGFNARRNIKWKNEIAYLAVIPPAFGIGRGSFAASLFPTLVGIEAPSGAKNLEVKPYAVADLTTDPARVPRTVNDPGADAGLDVKYGLTQSMTADFTYNTDFAQVEADEQQINLTRFSLFFPEKRDFFLENQGTFVFGSSTAAVAQATGDTPLLFYSRRIGLNEGLEVPILAGSRLTGRVGRFTIGAVAMRTRDTPAAGAPAATFAVVRLRRDILRRSSVGAMATLRSVDQARAGSNTAVGVDAALAFFANLAFNGYWATTRTTDIDGGETSYRAQVDYAGDRYGVQLDHLLVGANFNPEVGFVRRRGIRESIGQFRFSPRPRALPSVRKFSNIGTVTYIEDTAGRLQTRTVDGEFAVELQNSDRLSAGWVSTFERLTRPFVVVPGVAIPVGDYDFGTARAGYAFGQQRPVSGAVTVERGTFYDGRRTSISVSRTRVNPTSRFSLEPTASINWIARPGHSFTTNLVGSRVTYSVTPLMFASALTQYNSTTKRVSINVRLRWEYQPGSEIFFVYNEERDTLDRPVGALQGRALVLKVNRLFRF